MSSSPISHLSKVMLTVDGYDNPIDYLIEEGYLARPVFHSLPFEPTGLTTLQLAGLAESLEVPTAVLRATCGR